MYIKGEISKEFIKMSNEDKLSCLVLAILNNIELPKNSGDLEDYLDNLTSILVDEAQNACKKYSEGELLKQFNLFDILLAKGYQQIEDFGDL